jgi:hypothetical protein
MRPIGVRNAFLRLFSGLASRLRTATVMVGAGRPSTTSRAGGQVVGPLGTSPLVSGLPASQTSPLLKHYFVMPGAGRASTTLLARPESRGWSACADHDGAGSDVLGQVAEFAGKANPDTSGSSPAMTKTGVSPRRRPPCRRERAFDLNGAGKSAAKIRGSHSDGDHHRG